jgi:membrane protein
MQKAWRLLTTTVIAFINDEALGRGAAKVFYTVSQFYTVTSIAPVLLIVVAIAGMVFWREAAQNGIITQLSCLIAQQGAEILQTAVASVQSKTSGKVATVVGVVMVIVTASGLFCEMQTALNVIWTAADGGTPISRLIKARAAGPELVVSLGFLLMVSLGR